MADGRSPQSPSERQTFQVLVWNVASNLEKCLADLGNPRIDFGIPVPKLDIIAFQEVRNSNPFQNNKRIRLQGVEFECVSGDSAAVRVATLVNTSIPNIQPKMRECEAYFHIFELDWGCENPVYFMNVYQPPHRDTDIINRVAILCQKYSHWNRVVVGDFNAHHSSWSLVNQKDNPRGLMLYESMRKAKLRQTLPRGTVTFRGWQSKHPQSTIDLCFSDVAEIKTDAIYSAGNRSSDHFPLFTKFTVTRRSIARRRWKAADWRNMDKKEAAIVLNSTPLQSGLSTPSDIDSYMSIILDNMQQAASKSVTFKSFRAGFMKGDGAEIRRLNKQLKLAKISTFNTETHRPSVELEHCKNIQKEHRHAVRRLKRTDLLERIRRASSKGADLSGVITSYRGKLHPGTASIGAIVGDEAEAKTPEEMETFFFKLFFQSALEVIPEPETRTISFERSGLPDITDTELAAALRRLSLTGGSGQDQFPNELILSGLYDDHLGSFLPGSTWFRCLLSLYNASLRIGYCPKHFRELILEPRVETGEAARRTISYRAISHFNAIGIPLARILNQRLQYIIVQNDFLPKSHIGGLKGCLPEDVLHTLMGEIYDGLQAQENVVLVSLDTSKTFEHVKLDNFFYELRERKMDNTILEWIKSFLSARKTTIQLANYPDYRGRAEYVSVGIPDGSPLSSTLCILFSASLQRSLAKFGVIAGRIEDITLIIRGNTQGEISNKLQELVDICRSWSKQNAANISHEDFQIIHLKERKGNQSESIPPVNYGNHSIALVRHAKVAGITIDERLFFKKHIKHAKSWAISQLQQLHIAPDIRTQDYFQLYKTNILPQFLELSSVWSVGRQDICSTDARKGLEEVRKMAKAHSGKMWDIEQQRCCAADLCFLSSEQAIVKHITTMAIRMATGQTGRDLISKATANTSCKSPLATIKKWMMEQMNINLLDIGVQQGFVAQPWHRLPWTTLCATPSQANDNHDIKEKVSGLHLYTDASSISGHTGASVFCKEIQQHIKEYIGPSRQYSVRYGEVRAMVLALQLANKLQKEKYPFTSVVLFSDNKEAVRCATEFHVKSLLDLWTQFHHELISLTCTVEIHWIPSHSGIDGNEVADALAKHAATSIDPGILTGIDARSHNKYPDMLASLTLVQDWIEK